MMISVEEVREAVRKDDNPYMNSQILRLIGIAESSLFVAIGYKETEGTDCSAGHLEVCKENKDDFENLAKSYIVEYVRGSLDQVDNEKTLTILAVQCESLLKRRIDNGPKVTAHGNRKKRKN